VYTAIHTGCSDCLLASSQRNLYDINLLLYIQKTYPKHVDIYSKNKIEKLVHLVGFIIRIFKSNIQQQISYSDIPTKKSYLKANFFLCTAGLIGFFTLLHLVRIPPIARYFRLCLCCTVKVERDFTTTDIPSDEICHSSEHY